MKRAESKHLDGTHHCADKSFTRSRVSQYSVNQTQTTGRGTEVLGRGTTRGGNSSQNDCGLAPSRKGASHNIQTLLCRFRFHLNIYTINPIWCTPTMYKLLCNALFVWIASPVFGSLQLAGTARIPSSATIQNLPSHCVIYPLGTVLPRTV